ncbi:FACT complex subunit SPT16 [Intoshia linei]|uniref:FACT complex subunit n=1 Tax=Intoshia linei TaxID=1819745 RepID=A0A177BB87_9BILA|nr:FACT complex subunit SPT16 [Intoshia linei]
MYSEVDTDERVENFDAVISGFGNEGTIYSKSLSLQTWLIGVDTLNDTIIACLKEKIYFLASKKKVSFIQNTLKNDDKCTNEGLNFEIILDAIEKDKVVDHKDPIIGSFLKEKYESTFLESFWNFIKSKNCQLGHLLSSKSYINTLSELAIVYYSLHKVNATPLFSQIFSIKDNAEFDLVRKAAGATTKLYSKYVKENIINIIDDERKVFHSKLSEKTENAIKTTKYVGDLDVNLLEVCYSPIIQSGGEYSLKYSSESKDTNISFDVIICFIGLRFRNYCSNMVRTLMVSPNDKMVQDYEFLVNLQEFLMEKIRPGKMLSDIHKEAMKYANDNRPDLSNKLTPSFGNSIGIEFRDNLIAISAKCSKVVKKNMIFNVSVGLLNINNSETGDQYSLFVADTVIVNEDQCELLTNMKKKIKNVSIIIKDKDMESEEEDFQNNLDNFGRGKRNTILDNRTRKEQTGEEDRGVNQKEFLRRLNEAARLRYKHCKGDVVPELPKKMQVSYKNIYLLPDSDEIKSSRLFLDAKAQTLLLPIFGSVTVVHIDYIKNVTQSVEGNYTFLRINFAMISLNDENVDFIKELTFRGSNKREPGELSSAASNLQTVCRMIKETQKNAKQRELDAKQMKGIIKQDKLILNSTKTSTKISGLYVRPSNLLPKRINGVLTCHVNGFQYRSIRGDTIDILFNNIKHSFFQPCDSELIILLHFVLKDPILVLKKKLSNVQFYMEVGEVSTDLGRRRNGGYDEDELRTEQAERKLRKKLKEIFKNFCLRVESISSGKVSFEIPIRDLGFFGVPIKTTSFLMPSTNCLVQLSDWPPTVVSIDEIELVHFERVSFSIKNFDIVFVFKDYSKPVFIVNAVPTESLQNLKQWLHELEIHFTEGVQSLNWPKVMKTIVDDIDPFFDNGGWNFLCPESDVEESEDVEGEDENFQPTDSDTECETVSEESNDYSEEDENSDSSMEDNSESSKGWDELEKEAIENDKKKQYGNKRNH